MNPKEILTYSHHVSIIKLFETEAEAEAWFIARKKDYEQDGFEVVESFDFFIPEDKEYDEELDSSPILKTPYGWEVTFEANLVETKEIDVEDSEDA